MVSEPLQLRAEVYPEGATNTNVTWSTSNDAVATVDRNTGLVIGMSVGKVVITVTTEDGKFSDSVEIEVIEEVIGGDELFTFELLHPSMSAPGTRIVAINVKDVDSLLKSQRYTVTLNGELATFSEVNRQYRITVPSTTTVTKESISVVENELPRFTAYATNQLVSFGQVAVSVNVTGATAETSSLYSVVYNTLDGTSVRLTFYDGGYRATVQIEGDPSRDFVAEEYTSRISVDWSF